jgi:hypothetical protein
MAKAALDHYCRNASVPLAAKGVRINNLKLVFLAKCPLISHFPNFSSPGYIDTNIKLRGGATKEGLKKVTNQTNLLQLHN